MMFGTNPKIKLLNKKRGKYHNILLSDNDISLIVSGNFSENFKDKFMNHKRKHNVGLKFWHKLNTKKLQYFLFDNKQEPRYDSKPSAVFCGVLIKNIEDVLV